MPTKTKKTKPKTKKRHHMCQCCGGDHATSKCSQGSYYYGYFIPANQDF